MSTAIPIPDQPFFTRRELAALFDVHPDTVKAWDRAGKITKFKPAGRVKFPRSAVEAFVQSRTFAARRRAA